MLLQFDTLGGNQIWLPLSLAFDRLNVPSQLEGLKVSDRGKRGEMAVSLSKGLTDTVELSTVQDTFTYLKGCNQEVFSPDNFDSHQGICTHYKLDSRSNTVSCRSYRYIW